jgi:hypothetical protein
MPNRAQKNVAKTPKPKPRGRPFQPGNPWAIKKGEVRNPGGRPKLLSHAYLDWLKSENDDGVTNASGVALALGQKAVEGDISAARELRQTTEGDKFVFDLTKASDDQLKRIIDGEDPRIVLTDTGEGGTGTPQAEESGSAPDATGD